ncbi:MAG: cytochrome c oxidase subunit II [Ignavibacteria bacterium]|nr:cytochrome c oxidase subunit II [Ignavibacteria bacterium]
MFEGTSPFSDSVDATFLSIVGISALVLLGILAFMIYFLVRYSRKRNPHPENIEGNVALEVAWTAIPLVLFMGMFYVGWKGYLDETTIPDNAVPIKVTAQMWAWSFEYPNGVRADTLYVPVHTPMKILLHSVDVNHSFFIPSFRIKRDVFPNRETVMWFKTTEVAEYDIACAEYCGLRHSYMYNKVVSMDSVRFEGWYKKASIDQSKPYRALGGLSQ